MRAALLALVLGAGCRPDPFSPPSVLLVTMDTTRADHLGAYGFSRAHTPTLDRLAQEGRTFRRAYASVPLTIPGHSTILTGRYPPSHGVRDNGDFNLSPEEVTLAERFAEAGYQTAAFTSAFPTQARWGFDQGFSIYHDPLERAPEELDWRDQRTADQVVDDVISTLDDARGPHFVWVHLFDPHWPYDPPEPFRTEAGEGRDALYDGEIAFMDAELGRLLSWWDQAHPRSWVLATADHGEGLGDGGERTHGFLLHDGTLHVPLFLRGPGIQAGSQEEDPVSHVDIAPTLLGLAGLSLHPTLQGQDLLQGGTERPYSEALTGQFNLGLAPLHAYTDLGGRYTEGAYGAWYACQGDRIAPTPDPAWTAGSGEGREAGILERIRQGLPPREAPRTSLDPGALDQLMALGYVGGDPVAEAGTIDPRDVIRVIPLTWQARQAIGQGDLDTARKMIDRLSARLPGTFGVALLEGQLARRSGDMEAALTVFTDLFFRSPSSMLALHLADLHLGLGDVPEALAWYEEARAIQPASPEAMAGVVRCLLMLQEEDEARVLAEDSLAIYPDHAEILSIRAEIQLGDGRPDLAWPDARRAAQSLPYDPWVRYVAARCLWELGRSEEAIVELQDALALAPFAMDIRATLAGCLLDVGRNAEAVRMLRPLTRIFPDDPGLAALLGDAERALAAERSPHPPGRVP